MKKAMVFAVMLLVVVLTAQANQDFTFSLSGGSVHGKFSLASDFLYAGEFGKLFVQAAGFANLGQTKEYGGSIGLGILTDQGGDLYLFADTLYSYGKFWTQLRPTARLRFSWMSLSAFYALPLSKSTIQVDGQEICAAQYWGGELNLVPVPWARVYGNVFSVNKNFNFKFGAEVRPIKWVSLSAEWNKADSGIYSRWNNQDLRVAISLLFGNQQQSFSTNSRTQITPMYPVLAKKVVSIPEATEGEVEIQYRQMAPVVTPNVGINMHIHHSLWGGKALSKIETGEKTWVATTTLKYSPEPYWIWVNDYQLSDHPVAYEISIRVKGSSQWILLTHIVVNPYDAEGQAVQVVFQNGNLQPV